jgi:hypothetical protein
VKKSWKSRSSVYLAMEPGAEPVPTHMVTFGQVESALCAAFPSDDDRKAFARHVYKGGRALAWKDGAGVKWKPVE